MSGIDHTQRSCEYHLGANTMCRIFLLPISILLLCTSTAWAQDSDFKCEEHNLFVDRFPAVSKEPVLLDGPGTKLLATQDFSGFARYGIDAVKLSIRFDRDPDANGAPVLSGRIRVAAMIQAGGESSEQEIHWAPGREWRPDRAQALSILLRVRLLPADPSFDDSGSPAIRIQQAEAGVPIFLVKFIGTAGAGGWGDVASDNAMVLDLRRGALSAPAALGCIKDDFAGQGPGGGWANCRWDHAQQDYDCATSEGEFFFISGKKISHHRKPKRRG